MALTLEYSQRSNSLAHTQLQNSSITAKKPPRKGPPRPKLTRSVACDYCRTKKVRCSNTRPCTNCVDRRRLCIAPARYRFQTAKDPETKNTSSMADRLARVEEMLQGSTATQSNPRQAGSAPNHDFAAHHSSTQHQHDLSGAHIPSAETVPTSIGLAPPGCEISDSSGFVDHWRVSQDFEGSDLRFPITSSRPQVLNMGRTPQMTLSPTPQSTIPHQASFGHLTPGESVGPLSYPTNASKDVPSSPDEIREGGSICSGDTSNWEYHGPKSFLSVCSKSGIAWVAQRTGTQDFQKMAYNFTTDVSRRLKLERRLSIERKPEPDAETAWKFTKAYFEEALDAALGIVHRPWFESKLKAHLMGATRDDDPSWYALRNIIYASGCRILLCKSATFREANQCAWGWFENALSTHIDLLYFRTSFMGVQALTLMAYFSENIGTPCLEYMLCTIALRLAVSRGLHRQPFPPGDLSENERSHRVWLFWAAYCLEKHIVCQSGRPSIMADDEINCAIPTSPSVGSSINVFYCHTLIKLAQLSSLVANRLSTVRAFRRKPEALVNAVVELDVERRALIQSTKPIFSLDEPLNPRKIPAGMSLQQMLYLQYAYFNMTLDIHTVLTYPWSQSILGLTQHLVFRNEVEKSSQIVAQTCRDAILATKHIQLDASTPLLLSFYGPIHALINLFIYILQHPDLPRAQKDLTLLDLGAGHFAHLEFITDSEISVPFVKEMASLASKAIDHARFGCGNVDSENAKRPSETTMAAQAYEQDDASTGHIWGVGDLSSAGIEDPFGNFFDLELEGWSTFLPLPQSNDIGNFFIQSTTSQSLG